MGLRRPDIKWTEDEERILLTTYVDQAISKEEIMSFLPGRSWETIRVQAQKLGCKRRITQQYSVVSDYFSSIDSDVKAYWLGVMAADGCVYDKNKISLVLSVKDENLIRQFVSEVCPDYQIKYFPNTKSVGIRISDHQMRQDLERHGITPRKSYSLTWPYVLPDQYSMPFILGLFDGDGCLSWGKYIWVDGKKGGRWVWSLCGTESLLSEVKDRLERTLNIEIGNVSHLDRTPMCTIKTGGAKAEIIDSYMMRYDIGLMRKRICCHPHTLEEQAEGPQEVWVNVSEAARLLGIHKGTVRKRMDNGLINGFRTVGNQRRISMNEIEKLKKNERIT